MLQVKLLRQYDLISGIYTNNKKESGFSLYFNDYHLKFSLKNPLKYI